MANKEIHQQIRHYKSLRAAAACTGNRSEHQRCSEIIELLSEHLAGGARQ